MGAGGTGAEAPTYPVGAMSDQTGEGNWHPEFGRAPSKTRSVLAYIVSTAVQIRSVWK